MVKATMYNGKEGQGKSVYEEYVGTIESAIKAKVGPWIKFCLCTGAERERGGGDLTSLCI